MREATLPPPKRQNEQEAGENLVVRVVAYGESLETRRKDTPHQRLEKTNLVGYLGQNNMKTYFSCISIR